MVIEFTPSKGFELFSTPQYGGELRYEDNYSTLGKVLEVVKGWT